jgi:precorrin-6B methylase 2
MELHHVFEECMPNQYSLVVDIGAAEGYYAVGLARRIKCPVVAYDTEYRERKYCREMAAENGVSELVQVRSWCSPDNLRALADGRRLLVVCDCEGGEFELLTEDAVKSLSRSDLLVELHDVAGVDVKAAMLSRLAQTHNTNILRSRLERPVYQELAFFGADGQRYLSELRDAGQEWIWATSRS